jgi:hypothetical protein
VILGARRQHLAFGEASPIGALRPHDLNHAIKGVAHAVVHPHEILDGIVFGDDEAIDRSRQPGMPGARFGEKIPWMRGEFLGLHSQVR